MKSILLFVFNFCIVTILPINSFGNEIKWTYNASNFEFDWDLKRDEAKAFSNRNLIWEGSLLPGFWIKDQIDSLRYIKAHIIDDTIRKDGAGFQIDFNLDVLGCGTIQVDAEENSITITEISLVWKEYIPEIIEMYIGTKELNKEQLAMVAQDIRPFYPNWSSFGFCVPGAKEGPAQSYFRNWDFGQSEIALGSFGPSMGSPYGAAFPRPTYMAAMGNDYGWLCFAAGNIPDAAMSLSIKSSLGCFKYTYREDLWGAEDNQSRVWKDLIQISFGKNAYSAFKNYVKLFPPKENDKFLPQKAIWNTWGNWKNKEYNIQPIADFASKIGAEILVLDDPWESFQGSGKYSRVRFPNFLEDIEYINKLRMDNGIWETLAWIEDPETMGLSEEDLMIDRNGNPAKGSWNFNPFGDGNYILDISSEKAKKILIERTKSVVQNFDPELIKLDFGYGVPNPNIAVPRDPELRGERYAYQLTETIVKAAKEVKPEIIVMYYGISPMFLNLVDMVSLDDQGDLWYEQKKGHDQWSIWASLLSGQNVALNGSSSYDWDSDAEILLNTIVLGSPGSVLPNHINNDPVPNGYINRRYAVNKWFRRTKMWEPKWYNSDLGGTDHAIKINNWGRMEIIKGRKILTVLALKSNCQFTLKGEIDSYEWSGNWGIISQTNQDITLADSLAIIPFSDGAQISLPYLKKPEFIQQYSYNNRTEYKDWIWENNRLTITLNEGELTETAGFLVISK